MRVFIILLRLIVISPIAQTQAQEVQIDCSEEKGCTASSLLTLFSSSELWYPGKVLKKTIRIKNADLKDLLKIYLKAQNVKHDSSECNLAKKLKLLILQINTARPNLIIWEGTLFDFYQKADEIFMSDASSETIKDFELMVTMNNASGNECQDKSTSFDLLLNFTEQKRGEVLGKTTSIKKLLEADKTITQAKINSELKGAKTNKISRAPSLLNKILTLIGLAFLGSSLLLYKLKKK